MWRSTVRRGRASGRRRDSATDRGDDDGVDLRRLEGSVKRRTPVFALLALSLLAIAPSASAQLLAAKDGPIVYGHHHLNATNIEEQKKFFVNTLGGTAIKIGTNNTEIVKLPNVLIFFRMKAPTGGPRGSDRLRSRAGRGEGRARRGQTAGGTDPATPHPLLQSAERPDAGVVC